MVTDLFVSAFLAALTAMLTLLPALTLPSTVGEIFAWISNSIHLINLFFPAWLLALLILAGFGVEALLRLWDLVVWIYHQFWGSD